MCDDAAKAPTSAVLPAMPAEDVAPAQESVNEIAAADEISSSTGEATAEGTTDVATPSAAVTQDAGTSTGAAVEPATGLVPEVLGGLLSTGLL